ncbi:MAG TPA: hypothetical protein VGO96_15650, partial [Pyrinomonadaceae bacterium]|nr:hypothetical protein [Pyrinomonadaceae bacterium]
MRKILLIALTGALALALCFQPVVMSGTLARAQQVEHSGASEDGKEKGRSRREKISRRLLERINQDDARRAAAVRVILQLDGKPHGELKALLARA